MVALPPVAWSAAHSDVLTAPPYFVPLIYSWEAEADRGVIIMCWLLLLTFSNLLLLLCWQEPPPHLTGKWQRCCWCPSGWLQSHRWVQPSVLPVDLTRVKYQTNMMKAIGGRLMWSWRETFSSLVLLFYYIVSPWSFKGFLSVVYSCFWIVLLAEKALQDVPLQGI